MSLREGPGGLRGAKGLREQPQPQPQPQGGDGEPQGGARGPQERPGGLTNALRRGPGASGRGRQASYILFITVFGAHLTLIHQLKST